LYKLEQYRDCYAVYRGIIKTTSDEYETERRTNLSAVAAQLADRANIETEDMDTFELRSGISCVQVYWANSLCPVCS
jgi:signal recognition particle subunit SRP72